MAMTFATRNATLSYRDLNKSLECLSRWKKNKSVDQNTDRNHPRFSCKWKKKPL